MSWRAFFGYGLQVCCLCCLSFVLSVNLSCPVLSCPVLSCPVLYCCKLASGTAADILSQYDLQMSSIERLRDPQQITAFVKHRKEAAMLSARGPSSEAALTGFCDRMDDLLSAASSRMNHINFAAVITASAHIWEAAASDSNHSVKNSLHQRVEIMYKQCIQGLQFLLADVAPQQISTVLWSSATLGFNPDDIVPGMAHALIHRFLQLIYMSEERQRPNAQSCANLIWALATMRHPATTTEMLGSACTHFAQFTGSPFAEQRPKAREVASVVWSLGTLKHKPADDALLDELCMYMLTLLQSQHWRACPNAQAISNMLWALAELKHAPSHDVGSAMLDQLAVLCQTPGLQPTSQAISNSIHACAELRLSLSSSCVEILLNHLLGMPVSWVSYQHYSNVAWGLAVMERLDLKTFDALLYQLSAKHDLLLKSSGIRSRYAQPKLEEACQLHQALEALKPLQGLDQMPIWFSWCSRLQKVAPKPTPPVLSLPGQTELWAALAVLGVPCKARALCGMYRADAVLCMHDSNAAQVILMVDRAEECIANVPTRYSLPMLEG